jgi:hypothetical protein
MFCYLLWLGPFEAVLVGNSIGYPVLFPWHFGSSFITGTNFLNPSSGTGDSSR